MTNIILDGGIVKVVSPPTPVFVTEPPVSSSVVLVPVRGIPGPIRVFSQSPAETPNGIITTFTVPSGYLSNTLVVYLNGLQESFIAEVDDTTFTFDSAPFSTDIIGLDFNLS